MLENFTFNGSLFVFSLAAVAIVTTVYGRAFKAKLGNRFELSISAKPKEPEAAKTKKRRK